MSADRRAFLQQMTLSGLALSTLETPLFAGLPAAPDRRGSAPSAAGAPGVDMSWTKRLTGKHKAVYDSPDIQSGYGVWRAAIVKNQYLDVFGLKASDVSNVVVLRHDGIWLAMTPAFWEAYDVGTEKKVTHPLTEEPTKKHPAMLGEADGVPASVAAFAIDRQIAAGTIVLGCSLAFQDVVGFVAKRDKIDTAAADAKARAALIPGIIMQPSGVFATTVAQEQGCVYVRAT